MIIVQWHMYPVCATRINSLKRFKYNVEVFSERPKVPFKDFNNEIFPPKYINSHEDPKNIIKVDPKNIEALIITGWSHKKWLNYAKYLKKHGVIIIMMIDNNLRYSFKQILGKFYFRYFISSYADYYLVPGINTKKLLEFFGVKSSKIFTGYYGYTSKYFNAPKSTLKKRNFVFVGQKIKRKGIDLLIKSYQNYLNQGGDWGLKIIGHGKFKLPINKKIEEQEFLQPKDLSKVFQENYAFILPSRLEHWGTVVAEAAASGMILALSNKVGSEMDILKTGLNGFSFNPYSIDEFTEVLLKISSLNSNELNAMSEYSISISKIFSEDSFSQSINTIIKNNS